MKNYDPNDWKDSQDVVKRLVELCEGSPERTIAFLLMSFGNLCKHLAENVDENKYNEIMKDPLIAASANFAYQLMQAGDPLLKKYGFRKE